MTVLKTSVICVLNSFKPWEDLCKSLGTFVTGRSSSLYGTGRIQNRTKICTVPPVYTEDEFRIVPKFAHFHLFTQKTNSNRKKICAVPPVYTVDEFKPYQNLHSSACLYGRRIQTVPKFARFHLFTLKTNSNRTKTCTVPPVYTEDEFKPYQNLHSSTCLHWRWIQTVPIFARFRLFTLKTNSNRTKICTVPLLTQKTNSNRTKICTVPPVYTEDEFKPYQNLHSSTCLHRRRIQIVPKFAQIYLFPRKTNSEP